MNFSDNIFGPSVEQLPVDNLQEREHFRNSSFKLSEKKS